MRRVSIALLLSAMPCLADSTAPLDLEQRPSIDVPRLPRRPTLEDFLGMQPPSDLAAHVARVQGFVQQVPEDGLPASQLTDVFLGHDDENLYVVFVAWDEEPHRIRAHVTRREQVFADETVEIQIDTFDAGQRAYSFLTNPFGIQWDAIWTEGQGFDESWDTVWDSRGQLTEQGYVVWMAIPFKSLRFRPSPDGVPQSWRFILVRDIPRNNETSFWPRVSSRIEGRLNQAATARGFAGVSPGRNLWLIPYAAGAAQDVRDAPGEPAERSEEGDVGLDAKWVIRDRLALDATLNPNFAQVESDEAQVTINERFEVFFPERRPFFLENADYFRTPIDLLFTRRIVDPGLGARVTGQLGSYRVGALVVDDELPGKLAEPGSALDGERAWNGIARASRDLPNQSSVGFLFTDRELGDSYNRVAGFDTRLKLDRNWETQLQAVYATTRTVEAAAPEPAVELDGAAFTGMVNRFGRKLRTHLHYLDIGREFRTELGFVPRTDIRDAHGELAYDFRPSGRKLVRFTPLLYVQRIENHDGLRLDEVVQPALEWEFRRRTSFGVGGQAGRVRLLRCEDYADPSCSSPGAPAATPENLDFEVDELGVSFETSFVSSLDFNAGYEVGRSFNLEPPEGQLPGPADRAGLEVGLTLRIGRHVRVDSDYLRTELDDPAGAGRILTDQILRTRLDWQIGRRLSARAIVRHDDTDPRPDLSSAAPRDELNGDLLVTYLVNPWTALYLGANSNRTSTAHDPLGEPILVEDPFNDANLVFVKLSYLFRP